METLKRLTGGSGPDCVIDAVGVDASHAFSGPAGEQAKEEAQTFAEEVQMPKK